MFLYAIFVGWVTSTGWVRRGSDYDPEFAAAITLTFKSHSPSRIGEILIIVPVVVKPKVSFGVSLHVVCPY